MPDMHDTMAGKLLFVAAVLLTMSTSSPAASPPAHQNTTDFIRTSCNATPYPDLCYRTLAGKATAVRRKPAKLAVAAISLASSRSRYASSLLRSGKGSSMAIEDCVSLLSDAADDLRGSLPELRRADRSGNGRGKEFRLAVNNVLTAVSAALTDQETCTDGLSEEEDPPANVGGFVGRVDEVKMVTSNALGLIDLFVKRRGRR